MRSIEDARNNAYRDKFGKHIDIVFQDVSEEGEPPDLRFVDTENEDGFSFFLSGIMKDTGVFNNQRRHTMRIRLPLNIQTKDYVANRHAEEKGITT